MAENGQNTITKLKEATNIADNRLSAHYPSGPGVQTAMSDFFITGLDDNGLFYLNENTNNELRPGDTKTIYIPPQTFSGVDNPNNAGPDGDPGDYPGDPAIHENDATAVKSLLNGCLTVSYPSPYLQIDVTYPSQPTNTNATMIEVETSLPFGTALDDTVFDQITATWNDPGYNTDVLNSNPLTFQTAIIIRPDVVNIVTQNASRSGGTVTLDIFIQDGRSPYDVEYELARKKEQDTTFGPYVSINNEQTGNSTDTYSSKGPHPFSYSNFLSTEDLKFRFTVTDTGDAYGEGPDTSSTILSFTGAA